MSTEKTYELSKIQHLIWDKHKDENAFLGIIFKCNKGLEKENIEKLWEQLAAKNQILATKYIILEQSEKPLQRVIANSNAEILGFKDLNEANILSFVKEEKHQFNTGKWLVLFEKTSNNQTKLFVGASKLSTDKWSLIKLIKQFTNLTKEIQPEEYLPYAQFSEWLNNAQETQEIQAQRFWKEDRRNLPETNVKDDSFTNKLVKASIKKISKVVGKEYKSLCFAIASYVLSKHTGKNKLNTNWISDGRYFDELNEIQGAFSICCPLKIYVKNTIKNFQIEILEEIESQFEMLSEIFPEQKDTSLDAVFEYYRPENALETSFDFIENTNYASLLFEFLETEEEIRLLVKSNNSKFSKEYLECVAEQTVVGLHSFLEEENQAKFTLVSEENKHKLIAFSKGEKNAYSANFINEQLENAKESLCALKYQNREWSYKGFKEERDGLAQLFSDSSIKRGTKVCLFMNNTSQYIFSLFALWKIGAIAIPIHKSTPLLRMESCLKVSEASFLISEDEVEKEVENVTYISIKNDRKTGINTSKKVATVKNNIEDVAYILFTSGSTGEPKGCVINHGNLCNYLTWASNFYCENDKNTHFPFFTSIGFDFTFTSILLPLLNEGKVTVLDYKKTIDKQLTEIALDENISTVKITPSHIRVLKSSNSEQFKPNKVIVGGETLEKEMVDYLKAINPNIQIFNEYGPTEATVGCIVGEIKEVNSSITIGKPIFNTTVNIVDENKIEVPEYVIGELVLSGASLSNGYINLKEHKSFDSAHYYSGDLGYRDANGNYFFVGRKDNQIKIRGNRIEIEEIKSIALQFPAIEDAFVDVDTQKEKITLFIQTNNNIKVDNDKAMHFLKSYLMPYALPNEIIQIERFPLNTNGKIDLKELIAIKRRKEEINTIDFSSITKSKNYHLIKNEWKAVLKIEEINPTDHFIRLGGDSIKAIQLVNKLKQKNLEINIREILEKPILNEFVSYIENTKNKINNSSFEADESEVALNPNQKAFLERAKKHVNGYCQTVTLQMAEKVNKNSYNKALQNVLKKHKLLNARFVQKDGSFTQVISENTSPSLLFKSMSEEEYSKERSEKPAYDAINLENGPLFLVYLVSNKTHDVVHLFAHHLIIDAVSWQILIEDINEFYEKLLKNETLIMPQNKSYNNARVAFLKEKVMNGFFKEDKAFWDNSIQKLNKQKNWLQEPFLYKNVKQKEFYLDINTSLKLKSEANNKLETQPIELLLTGISRAFKQTQGINFSCVMENHGRQSIQNAPNVESSIGWFTTIYPIFINSLEKYSLEQDIKNTTTTYREATEKGMSFGYLYNQNAINLPKIQVNYLGVYEDIKNKDFSLLNDVNANQTIHPEVDVQVGLNLSIIFADKGLHFVLSYDEKIEDKWLNSFISNLENALFQIAAFCMEKAENQHDYSELNDTELEDILGELE